MTIALVSHAVAGGLNGATTSSIDTTGATLLVVEAANYNGSTTAAITVSDSKGNTWTACNEYKNPRHDRWLAWESLEYHQTWWREALAKIWYVGKIVRDDRKREQ